MKNPEEQNATHSPEERGKMIKRALLASGAAIFVAAAGIWLFTSMPVTAESKDAKADPVAMAALPGNAKGAIDGFRSAQFGGSEKQIRDAIKSDLGKTEKEIRIRENAATRVKALVVKADNLVPDTGPAEIGYLLGYKSKELMQVNVVWGTPVTPSIEGKEVARTAMALKDYFSRQGYDPAKTIRDRKIRGGILVFQAMDEQGRLVRLAYREFPTKPAAKPDQKSDSKKADKRAYVLTLSYVADPTAPDVFRIEEGSF